MSSLRKTKVTENVKKKSSQASKNFKDSSTEDTKEHGGKQEKSQETEIGPQPRAAVPHG